MACHLGVQSEVITSAIEMLASSPMEGKRGWCLWMIGNTLYAYYALYYIKVKTDKINLFDL